MTAFRSVNIAEDLGRDSVLSAYRPTAKSLEVVRAVTALDGSRATHVVSPYGTGKSIAALVGVALLSNERPGLTATLDAIARLDPGFSARIATAPRPNLAILLHGACPDLPAALCEAAGLPVCATMKQALAAVLRHARALGAQRITIVWDEFGHHLDTLVRDGRSEGLLAVQELAEWAVRRDKPSVSFTTLMHRGMQHYTRRLSDNAQAAWKKIEGRFETLALIEDGAEAVEMVADMVANTQAVPEADLARQARQAGFFPGFADSAALARVLARARPLAAATLDRLPRIAALIAQNERTVVRFLQEVLPEAEGVVGLDQVYDWFAPAMQADTGPAGTHRRLVEAETALGRTGSALERQIVKAATLLQLGGAGERARLPMARLVFAVAEGTGRAPEAVEAAIAALIARKILLHRRRADDVSVWHGADLDLGALVAEEAERLSRDLDMVAELERLFPPESYTAPRYNFERVITRFARGRYVTAAALKTEAGQAELCEAAAREDALVALVIDGTEEDAEIRAAAERLPEHVILAVPLRAAEITPALRDLRAVERLLAQRDLLESDPLVARELHELRSEAELTLREGLEHLMVPDRAGVVWYLQGQRHGFSGGTDAGALLSQLFDRRFPQTPVLRNEQVVRRRVSAVSRSARRRCMLAVIERSGEPALGYEGSTAADASLYRTIYEATGLYRAARSGWHWAAPEALESADLRRVWACLETFFAEAEAGPKPLSGLLDRLLAPPIGLREGVLPLLVAAGLQAFGRSIALRMLTEAGMRYVDDIQPSLIEQACETPEKFEVEVCALSAGQQDSLRAMIESMSGAVDPQEPDLVRAFYDALLQFKKTIPPTALKARGLGPAATRLQPLLRQRGFDPLRFLIADYPQRLGEAPLSAACAAEFATALAELMEVSTVYAQIAADVARKEFAARSRSGAETLLEAAETWAASVPLQSEDCRHLNQEARGIFLKAKAARRSPRGELGFITALSGILFGVGFNEWDDTTAPRFQEKLRAAIARVEDYALDHADGSGDFEPFVKNRIKMTLDAYGDKIGRDSLVRYLTEIYAEDP